MESNYGSNSYMSSRGSESGSFSYYTPSINSRPMKKKDSYSKYKSNSSLSEDGFKIPNIDNSTIRSTDSYDSLNSIGEINIIEIDNGNENPLNLPCINIHQNKNVGLSKNKNKNFSNKAQSQNKTIVKRSKNSNTDKINISEESHLFEKSNILPKSISIDSNNITSKQSM